jgi:hypothetical protein
MLRMAISLMVKDYTVLNAYTMHLTTTPLYSYSFKPHRNVHCKVKKKEKKERNVVQNCHKMGGQKA